MCLGQIFINSCIECPQKHIKMPSIMKLNEYSISFIMNMFSVSEIKLLLNICGAYS